MTTPPKSQGAAIDQAGAPAALPPVEIDAKLYASLQHVGGALCDAVPFREVKAFADHFAASLLAAPAGDTQQASEDARDAIPEQRNLLRVHVLSDQSVTLSFMSARACSSFIQAVEESRFASQANKAGLDGVAK